MEAGATRKRITMTMTRRKIMMRMMKRALLRNMRNMTKTRIMTRGMMRTKTTRMITTVLIHVIRKRKERTEGLPTGALQTEALPAGVRPTGALPAEGLPDVVLHPAKITADGAALRLWTGSRCAV